jgi:hypothetical protein
MRVPVWEEDLDLGGVEVDVAYVRGRRVSAWRRGVWIREDLRRVDMIPLLVVGLGMVMVKSLEL